jgi:lysophospholipase
VERAPFHDDLAEAPDGGTVVWRRTSDGIRLRLGWWAPEDARGTVLLFPGRTEYLEKYGRIAGDLTAAGYAVVSIDWRGQGLSDRLDDDRHLGHVTDFLEYQKDVDALIELVQDAALPSPRFLLAHSMGGCIGLRALVGGLDVARAVFTAPMWGIKLPALARPLPHIVPPIARLIKKERQYAPGTRPVNYITETGFAENMLTTDRATYDWLGRHAAAAPEFALGGPSVQWVGAATRETRRLFAAERPAHPVLTFLGSDEMIVSSEAIRRFHANWPSARLVEIAGARHEIMMEAPELRQRFLDETLAFLAPDAV